MIATSDTSQNWKKDKKKNPDVGGLYLARYWGIMWPSTPGLHHPLEIHYDPLVDEPQLSYEGGTLVN
jgi:hypothetical protein